jgi:hypothetical protein
MYRRQIQIFVLLLLIVLIGCATNGGSKLTPKQNATVWMQVYNSTYDDTMLTMQNPLATPEQKNIALQKKAILTQIWPLLKVYVATVEGGATPSAEMEATLSGLINQLTALAIGGK